MRTIKALVIALSMVVIAIILYNKLLKTPHISNYPPPITNTALAPSLDEAPYQRKYKGARFRYKGALIEPVHEFIITARVLAKKDYSDNEAKHIPTDIGLGWGKMADDAVLKDFTFMQVNRKLGLRAKSKLPKELLYSYLNMHTIPANDSIAKAISQIQPDQIVQISGKLVNYDNTQGTRIQTSTSRKDTDCEIVFVESVRVLD